MSQPMKILLGVFGLLLVASVGLTMFGKPPNLPLGPLQGIFASDDAADTTATDAGAFDPNAGLGAECGPGLGTSTDPLADPAAGGAIDPATGAPAAGATDPATGAPAAGDPAAGAIDPATGASTAGATDPATGAPVASGADGWNGSERVVAASAGSYDPGRVSDSYVVAAEAVDPTTGLPADPAAGGAADPAAGGATDPAAGGVTDPAAVGGTDPSTGMPVDPCAGLTDGAGAATGTDPLADPGAGFGTGTDPGAGAAGTAPAAGAAGTAPGAGAGGAAAAGGGRTTTDGINTGNSPEALRAAKDATAVMQKAKISVTTTATLVPSTGGIGRPAAVKRYRGTVTAAVLVMKLDAAAQQQWTGAGKKVQADLVKSFLARLGKTYPKASRSVTVVDESGNVLAIGDAPPRSAGRVKLF